MVMEEFVARELEKYWRLKAVDKHNPSHPEVSLGEERVCNFTFVSSSDVVLVRVCCPPFTDNTVEKQMSVGRHGARFKSLGVACINDCFVTCTGAQLCTKACAGDSAL